MYGFTLSMWAVNALALTAHWILTLTGDSVSTTKYTVHCAFSAICPACRVASVGCNNTPSRRLHNDVVLPLRRSTASSVQPFFAALVGLRRKPSWVFPVVHRRNRHRKSCSAHPAFRKRCLLAFGSLGPSSAY